jgi:Arc/MetJ-type ribon-helix-helix transcriptional regulator
MAQMNIPIPIDAQRLVQKRVRSGEFRSPSQYVRTLILKDQKRRQRRKLESTLLRRLDRSDAVEMNERDIASLGRKIERVVSRRKSA